MHVNGTVNGFDISEDFVTLHGEQILYGAIVIADNATFHGNISTRNVTLHGLVNNVNITKLNEDAVSHDSNLTVYGNKVFTRNTSVDGCVFVEGTVNGVDIDHLYHEAVTLSDDEVIRADLEFISDVNFTHNVSVIDTVNGLHLYEFLGNLVFTDTNETIIGTKIFFSDVVIDSNLNVTGLLNEVDLRELDRSHLSRHEDQAIPGEQEFLQNVSADVLTIGDDVLIDGVNISKVILIDNDNDIDETLVFSNIVIDGDLNVGGYIGGFNITEYDGKAVRVTDSTVFISGLKELYNITVSGDLDLIGTVNGTFLPDMFDNTFGKENLTLVSPVVFEDFLIIEENAWFNGLVNGENISFLLQDAVLYSEAVVISGNKIITGDVGIDNLVISGDFNGNLIYDNLTLKEILNHLVLRSENASIHGSVVFEQDITVNGDISVLGFINEFIIPDDFVLQNATQTLAGENNFMGGITFAANVSVTNLVDTADLDYIAANMVTLSTEQLITGTWTLATDVSVRGSTSVTGLINGFNIHTDIVTTFGEQTIYGSKTFTGDLDVLNDMFTTSGNINKLPPKWFHEHVVVEHVASQIYGHKVFTDEVYFAKNVTVLGYVLGVDLSEMMNNFELHMEKVEHELRLINESLSRQCRPIYLLEEAYKECQAVQLSHFEDYQTINRTNVARIAVLPYEDTLLLSLVDNQLSHHCLESSVYMYNADENDYFKVNDLIASTSAKMYSFSYPNQTFVVLPGSVQSAYCPEGIDYNGITRVYRIDEYRFIANISSETPVDTDMIDIDGDIYLSIANSEDTLTGSSIVSSALYRYATFDEEFVIHQTFETKGASTTLFIKHGDNDPWLVYANKYDSELDSGSTTTDIYQWNSTESKFQIQHQIAGECIVSVVSIVVDDEPCVVAASERSSDDFSNYYMPVTTVCHENGLWTVKNTLEGEGVIGLDEFSIDGTPYLVVVSRFHKILVYSWCGISGFELQLTIPYSNVNSVYMFEYQSNLLMGVTRTIVNEIADQLDEPQILKGIINGLKEDTVIEA
ncbi:uncharacterized protein LOC117112533 [Anneissia japonica]|uniref:uncharacterized protein LOC117112533 n=1 Tax=Anneissia japonica TaxID=1529436 RepID=UPI001425637A|nr:uncharacterized protein LOC117112533 [Anneissia japonica]